MNERAQDFELLQRFARHGEQRAFADVVRRHPIPAVITVFSLGLVIGMAASRRGNHG